MKTWRQLEKLVDLGMVRHIGTSNMTIPKLKLLLRDARIQPTANEMELHPHFQQPELFKFVVDNGIIPIGFLADWLARSSGARPHRGRYRRYGRPGDPPDRAAARHPPGNCLPEMGDPARAKS